VSLQLDHVVIAVHDLEATIADYLALGFNVQRGGDHPGRSTHNALVVFADGSYLELIAWKSPAPQERWWQLLKRRGEGIVDFALLPADTGETVALAAQRGLALEGPLDGGRVRPDGERLHWQTARPATHDLPFLCGDITPRRLRVPEGDARVHANGATGVASLAIAVRDLDASLLRYRALLGDSRDTHVGRGVTLPARHERLALVALGAVTLVLSSTRAPGHSGEPVDDDEGDPVARRLAAHGEGPFSLALRTSGTAVPVTPDLARTHGANIEFEQQGAASQPVRSQAAALAEPA
jgi:catechol 2,3-dioxygenase-like lactoylglutathione lyase family enzyme